MHQSSILGNRKILAPGNKIHWCEISSQLQITCSTGTENIQGQQNCTCHSPVARLLLFHKQSRRNRISLRRSSCLHLQSFWIHRVLSFTLSTNIYCWLCDYGKWGEVIWLPILHITSFCEKSWKTEILRIIKLSSASGYIYWRWVQLYHGCRLHNTKCSCWVWYPESNILRYSEAMGM